MCKIQLYVGIAALSGLLFASSSYSKIQVTELASGLNHPWGIAFLPNGDALITERNGSLRKLNSDNQLSETIKGLPEAVSKGQGGTLGVAISPNYAQDKRVYVCVNVEGENGWGSEVHSGVLNGEVLENVKPIFVALPKSESNFHFGCRIVFDNQGHMFVSLGDRGAFKEQAQNTDNHLGAVVRVTTEGKAVSDNPFISGDAPEIYTFGHRNVQGMAKHPISGDIWTNEHGPKGGDEVNILSKGKNYGWPAITYGVNYDGTVISDKTAEVGMEQPTKYWVPSFAPSGMMFYTGDEFSEWKNNLFVGSLKFRYLKRLVVENNQIVNEEDLLTERDERIRDVAQAPDGSIYLLTDSDNGKVLRLTKQGS
ncbi:PQQ-dependent sugar dehydrogenase [Agaribacter flavus]|uniref:PQQ-dependent sugar dehydrogenase n=1 Tax=Agaribacter flavus TaxID=1902781 RepID=A0ABV7FR65_9ALTE